MGQTDGQTDGQIAVSLNAPYDGGIIIKLLQYPEPEAASVD